MTVTDMAGEDITAAVVLLLLCIGMVGVASYQLGYDRGARTAPTTKPLPEPEIEPTAPLQSHAVVETAALYLEPTANTDQILIPIGAQRRSTRKPTRRKT